MSRIVCLVWLEIGTQGLRKCATLSRVYCGVEVVVSTDFVIRLIAAPAQSFRVQVEVVWSSHGDGCVAQEFRPLFGFLSAVGLDESESPAPVFGFSFFDAREHLWLGLSALSLETVCEAVFEVVIQSLAFGEKIVEERAFWTSDLDLVCSGLEVEEVVFEEQRE